MMKKVRQPFVHPRRKALLILLGCLLGATGLLAFWPALAAQQGQRPDDTAGVSGKGGSVDTKQEWRDVERLIGEQKFQEALEKVSALRLAAEQQGDPELQTRALVREVQLTKGLHADETAVRLLRSASWPDSGLERAVLEIFYGQSLVDYLQRYRWEIAQRERTVTSGEGAEVDLEAWTAEQIYDEAQQAFLRAWQQREVWGARPVDDIPFYLQPNQYPDRIRGTLRDAISYLWVELLADTGLWRPEWSDEIYRLDLSQLVAKWIGETETGEDAEAVLADPQRHPLVRIAAILGDLETWHLRSDRPEAAFEAHLERLRRLRDSFTLTEEAQALRQDLERHLEELGRNLPWWSMGMAELARFHQMEDRPDSLIRAREIAQEGRDAHPGSVGGKRCAHLVATLEAPSYQLTAMRADGAGRRSIQVEHKNLDRLYFRAYAVDLRQQVESAKDYNLLPSHREVEEILRGRRPAAEWAVELPPTPDLRQHRTFVVPPMTGPGLFVVVASARQDFAEGKNRRAAVNLILSDLVLITREGEEVPQAETTPKKARALEVTVRSGASGEALAGVTVDLYRRDWQKGHRRESQGTTDAEGRLRFAPEADGRSQYFLVASRGQDANLDVRGYAYYDEGSPEEHTASLVYTDRSIYRPGQEILWKVVAYRGDSEAGSYRTLPETQLTLTLHDANGEEVASQEATTNGFGSASGRFEIPFGRLLGGWYLESSLDGGTGIQVEEYKRPTFEVTLEDAEDPLRLNRPATLKGSVQYYFGLPVTSGQVSWRVVREPVYPYWWFWGRGRPTAETRTLAAGTASLDAEGRFEVIFTPEADERLAESGDSAGAGVTWRYRLSVDVTDEGGETRSASRSFRLGFVAVEATLSPESNFFLAGQPAKFSLRRTNLDGAPQPGEASWRLTVLEQPPETLLPAERPVAQEATAAGAEPYHTPGDLKRPRWDTDLDPAQALRQWPDGGERSHGSFVHGEDGTAQLTLDELPPGAYRLHYQTRDAFGALYETAREFLVAAPDRGTPLHVPVLLLAENPSVAVGETARFLVHSGLTEQPMEFEILQNGRLIERRSLRHEEGGESGTWPRVIELPIEPRHRGGLGVRLTLLRDHQLMSQVAQVFVPWDDRRLEVSFSTFRDRLRPGERETWRVTVKAAAGEDLEPAAAELLAYMYDRSLDLFGPHHPPDPLSLYPVRYGASALNGNLGLGGEVWQRAVNFVDVPSYPHLAGDELKFLANYGIGGPGMRSLGTKMRRMASPQGEAAAIEEAVVVTAESPVAVSSAQVGSDLRRGDELQALGFLDGGQPAAKTAPEAPPEAPEVEPRTDFSETAFWQPHLRLESDGSVSFEFEVPDSVTEWSVWAHALTKDLRAGSVERRTKTVKELLVRPYLPRFLREGDQVELEVVINNAGEEDLEGTLDFDLQDPETETSRLEELGLGDRQTTAVPFQVKAGGSTSLTFPLTVPPGAVPVGGGLAVRAVARAGEFSDGELRSLPVLPGRLHLFESRFATLHGEGSRRLHFADLAASNDPTRIDEQLVVTLDAQLFYSVLYALPYLVQYPYECTEQTLNRFVSTGIVSTLYDDYPAVARMAEKFSERETQYESWAGADPNRKMALEETPWLVMARGGDEPPEGLINVLDPQIAAAQREASLAQLAKAQTSLGAFPWWPGGPPSPYMTLYLLSGFSRALEYGVEIPQDMVQRAWAYMHRHYLDEMVREMVKEDCCWEMVTFLNYVLSSYPDDQADTWTGGVFTAEERRKMLDFSFRHWRQHSPRLKGYLALTLKRAGRDEDARLVFDSVMDSAKTTEDEGTFWAPEDRAWLWYNDTVETHAFALRVLMELDPDDARRHGLVQWLMLNKKLGHWKSTRATAEVVYSLVHYLEKEGALGVREDATVRIGDLQRHFVFEPDEYTGRKNQVVVPGEAIDPATMATVEVSKDSPGLLFASATWHFSTEELPAEARGDFFAVTRRYFKRVNTGDEWTLRPLEDGAVLAPGDQVEVQLSVRSRHAAEYVHLRDPRGAGFEPESTASRYRWDLGLVYYEEIRDSGTNFFFEWLPAGEYTFKYRLRVSFAGAFRVGPATVQSMYAPEFVAYSSGARLEVAGGE